MSPYRFDPELAPYVDALPTVTDFRDIVARRAEFAEEIAKYAVGPRPETSADVMCEDVVAPGVDDPSTVALRVYRSTRADVSEGAIVQVHGGGFVMGSIDESDPFASMLCARTGATVVAVEYRLAPEHPFPAGLHDCYAALAWVHEHHRDLGVTPSRIALAGQSAGGALAAGTALLARDRAGPPVRFLSLGIPVLDDRLDTPSMREFVDTPLWNRPNAEQTWAMYLGGAAGDPQRPEASPYAAPARAADLHGLPPAYISTMELDPLRDEGIAFASRLLASGVPVELHQFPGTFHGSELIATAAVSKRIVREYVDALRRAIGTSESTG